LAKLGSKKFTVVHLSYLVRLNQNDCLNVINYVIPRNWTQNKTHIFMHKIPYQTIAVHKITYTKSSWQMPQCTKSKATFIKAQNISYTTYTMHKSNYKNLMHMDGTTIWNHKCTYHILLLICMNLHKIIIFHGTSIYFYYNITMIEERHLFCWRTTRLSCINLTLTISFNYLVNHYKHLVQSLTNFILGLASH
jgi:hypothetical protein